MNDLSKLFTKKNLLILKEIASRSGTYIREISENTGTSPAQVHQAVKLPPIILIWAAARAFTLVLEVIPLPRMIASI